MSKPTVVDQVLAAREVSTPLIAINTPDPAATLASVCTVVDADVPKLLWDCTGGFNAINKAAQDALASAQIDPQIVDAATALTAAARLPAYSLLFVNFGHLFTEDPMVIQATWSLRDQFKTTGRTLIFLGPDIKLPPEWVQDVIVLEEQYPTEAELRELAVELSTLYGEKVGSTFKVTPQDIDRAANDLRGMSKFCAEQTLSMSFTSKGIDHNALWELRKVQIKQVPGLSFETSTETLDDLGGLGQIKTLANRIFHGKKRPKLVVRVEEGDKIINADGPVGDNGVSRDQYAVMLQQMEDNGWTGMILEGPPGTAKSAISKGMANTFGVRAVILDPNAAKDSLMGSSEKNAREQMRTIRALGGDSVLFIMSANALDSIPAPLRRRYKLGIYFCDIPSAEERDLIWPIHLKKFGLEFTKEDRPDDSYWTGAEIRNCCEMAWQLDCSLKEASQFIVPVAKSDPEGILAQQRFAHNRLLSTSSPGVYRMPAAAPAEVNQVFEKPGLRNFISLKDVGKVQ